MPKLSTAVLVVSGGLMIYGIRTTNIRRSESSFCDFFRSKRSLEIENQIVGKEQWNSKLGKGGYPPAQPDTELQNSRFLRMDIGKERDRPYCNLYLAGNRVIGFNLFINDYAGKIEVKKAFVIPLGRVDVRDELIHHAPADNDRPRSTVIMNR
jgi:hypothetical protein